MSFKIHVILIVPILNNINSSCFSRPRTDQEGIKLLFWYWHNSALDIMLSVNKELPKPYIKTLELKPLSLNYSRKVSALIKIVRLPYS